MDPRVIKMFRFHDGIVDHWAALVGDIAPYPDNVSLNVGSGPFPGVIDMFGAHGGTVEHRASLLASRGIAALALCYFTPEQKQVIHSDMEYYVVSETLEFFKVLL